MSLVPFVVVIFQYALYDNKKLIIKIVVYNVDGPQTKGGKQMQNNQFVKGLSVIVVVGILTGCAMMTRTTSGGVAKKGFVENIESIAVKNTEFRRVLYTAKNLQLVVMALKPREEIGLEVHKLDQFFRVEEGAGEVVIDGVRASISAGYALLIPAGANHNIINSGSVPLKLYTLYAPPNHRDGVVHHTRADAEKDNERFDGKATE
jgi:mannose-6-phosphate isomerase-like protein (cupin superfamily)